MPETDRDQAEAQKYPHVVRFVRETPWAILESKLQEITELIQLRASGIEMTREEIEARIGAGPAQRRAYVTDGNVAVIPVYGVIVPRADLFSEMSGGTSIAGLQQSLRAAAADPKITGILLDIDSPGGSVDMVSELAKEIRAIRKQKPVMAVANTMAASAGYWIGSQATSFSVTPSGSVGSVGVIAMHDDLSAMHEKLGVKTTMITAGKYKGELSPLQPLSEEARAMVQDRVDKFYGMFTQDVEYGRGVPAAAVRDGFGQGRMLLAKDALAAGMVDAVETYDQALAKLSSGAVSKGGRTRADAGDINLAVSGETIARIARKHLIAMGRGLDGPPDEPDDPPGDEPEDEETEAAESGLFYAHSWAEEADELLADSQALLERTTSLAEVKRGALTGAKRGRLSACTEALRETTTALEGLLEATKPTTQADDQARRNRDMDLMRVRLNLRGGHR